MSGRLCFVEDDPTIAQIVTERLVENGYSVVQLSQAESLSEAAIEGFDLFILDRLLAGRMSGLELCERIRRASPQMPILVLSALCEPSHRVEGLRVGADDYLPKPFEMEELLLRVEALLRRRAWFKQERSHEGRVLRWGQSWVNFEAMRGGRGNVQFTLTQKEGMLLKLLVQNEGRVVPRDEILNRVWGYSLFPSTRTVDNFILRLRKLFEEEPGNPRHFLSVRGVGYRFEP